MSTVLPHEALTTAPPYETHVQTDEDGRVRRITHSLGDRKQDLPDGTPAVRVYDSAGRLRWVGHYQRGRLWDPPDGSPAMTTYGPDGTVEHTHHYPNGFPALAVRTFIDRLPPATRAGLLAIRQVAAALGEPEPRLVRHGGAVTAATETTFFRATTTDPTSQLHFASAGAALGLPLVAPLSVTPDKVGEFFVSTWPFVRNEGPCPMKEVGAAVSELHRRGQEVLGEAPLSSAWGERFAEFVATRRRLMAERWPPEVASAYDRLAAEIGSEVAEARWADVCLVHGAPSSSNSLRLPGGGLVLVDYDDLQVAPSCLDQAVVTINTIRRGGTGAFEFLEGQGKDLAGSPDWPVVLRAREFCVLDNFFQAAERTGGSAPRDAALLALETFHDRSVLWPRAFLPYVPD